MFVEKCIVFPLGSYFATNTPPNPVGACSGFTRGKTLLAVSLPLTYTFPAVSRRGGAMMATSPLQHAVPEPTKVDQTKPPPAGFNTVKKPVFWQLPIRVQLVVPMVSGKS